MKIAALAGGVGGARLAHGLSLILPPDDLSVIVNTGDDFAMFGLYLCPDLDTVTYTLAGIANPQTGWGIQDDTFYTFEAIKANGGPSWFRLGDRDLATHLERTRLLQEGKSLTEVASHFNQLWHVKHPVLPMCDQAVPTLVDTREHGRLTFQEYFVKYRWEPRIQSLHFSHIDQAKPSEKVMNALRTADVVIICPSNPLVSIDPILSLAGVRDILKTKYTLAVSPIIGGAAIKGPLAKMATELGLEVSPVTVANHYADYLNCIFIDIQDESYAKRINQSGIIVQVTDILMPDATARKRLAAEIINYLKKK